MSAWLTGRRVVVTRSADRAGVFINRLRALGAEPIPFPVIATALPEADSPLDQAIARLDSYDWVIFTSANGVESLWARLEQAGETPNDHLAGKKLAAVGSVTAEALRRRGALVDLVPREFRAEGLLDDIGDVAGQTILLPCADIARPTLDEGLRAKGAHVDRVVAYHTVLGQPEPAAFGAVRAGVDVVTFTSSSSVRNFLALTEGIAYGEPLIACIGPATAATARKLGLGVDLVAQEQTIDGLIKSLTAIN